MPPVLFFSGAALPPAILLPAAMSFLSFLLFGADKHRARRGRRRISERTLLLTAFLGGAAGAALGMLLWRHKTRHLRFRLLVPLFLLLQLAAALYLL